MTQKNKYFNININIATKENEYYSPKKCAKLRSNFKHSKKYSIDISFFRKTKEIEEKDEKDKIQ